MAPDTTPSPSTSFEQYETGTRRRAGFGGALIALVAGAWSLFQLAIAKHVLLSTEVVRCVHLAFAVALVYLSFPAVKRARSRTWLQARTGKRLAFLFDTSRIHAVDYVLSFTAALVALYLMLDYEGIGARLGAPLARDLAVGVILVVLLLEAARRALGLALPLIASCFILYSFVSEHMPGIIAFKNATLSKLLNQLTLTSEGIYGVPLDVSASVVFLFVLFGAMLEKAGGGHYFIELAFSALGRFRGGPAKAAVLASGLTGMVNGSSIANTVTTGTFTIPLMKRTGFPAVKAGAIEVAASTNGQLMPPIMGAAAFIIAEYCNLTYFEVVRAAFVPAIISYLALIFITHLEASKLGLQPLPREELPRFSEVFFKGIHFLIPLGFLLYQLIIARRSAQLSGYYAILALAGLMVARHILLVVKGDVAPVAAARNAGRELWESLVAGGRNMMSIGVAVAAAGIIVGVVTLGLGGVLTAVIGILAGGRFVPLLLTVLGVFGVLTTIIRHLSGRRHLPLLLLAGAVSLALGVGLLVSGGGLIPLLLITAVVSLILGMGLPTTANYIVMATLTVPAIVELSGEAGLVVPLIAAHLFCFYFGILSDDTPPVGLSAYAAAAISREDPIKTGIQGFMYDIRTAILPFMFIFNTDLLLIGIDRWWQVALVFFTGMIAMFAFAALTQHHFATRNRWYDSLALGLVTLVLLRPDLFSGILARWVAVPKGAWYLVGVVVFAGVYAWQRGRREGAQRSTSDAEHPT